MLVGHGNEFTSGDITLLRALIDVGKDIQNWPDEVNDVKMYIGNFLAKALNAYLDRNRSSI